MAFAFSVSNAFVLFDLFDEFFIGTYELKNTLTHLLRVTKYVDAILNLVKYNCRYISVFIKNEVCSNSFLYKLH